MLHTAHRSGTGPEASTANERRRRGASLAATVLAACGGSDTGAAPVDSRTEAIYGSSRTKLLFSSNAGVPTPHRREMITTSSAKHPAGERVFVGVLHGGRTVAPRNQLGESARQGGDLASETPNSQGDL